MSSGLHYSDEKWVSFESMPPYAWVIFLCSQGFLFFLVLSTLIIINLGEIFFLFILVGVAEHHENLHFCLSSTLENLGQYSSNIFSNHILSLFFFGYYNYTWLGLETLFIILSSAPTLLCSSDLILSTDLNSLTLLSSPIC